MSIGDTTETNILSLIFLATAWANIADNAASSPETNLDYGLQTAVGTDANTMATNEAAYTPYARVNVARSGSGHTVTGGSVSPDANVDFAAGTAGGETVTHFAVGKTGGGAADMYWTGTVTPSIITGDGITPRLTTATACTLD